MPTYIKLSQLPIQSPTNISTLYLTGYDLSESPGSQDRAISVSALLANLFANAPVATSLEANDTVLIERPSVGLMQISASLLSSSGTTASSFDFTLEDGSGSLLLENGSGYLETEAGP